MDYLKIPNVSAPASRLGLGTWAMGGFQWGGTDDAVSVRTIHTALDQGISLIDTAPAYGFGHAEAVVGRALAEHGRRDQVVIATKVGLERRGDVLYRNSTPAQIASEVDTSLRLLRTDYIDLYLVHWPDPAVPVEESARALLAVQQAGKVRALGVSNYSVAEMERFHRVAPLAAVQPPHNLFERQPEQDVLPWARAHGLVALTYGSLCRGLLTGTIGADTRFPADDLRRGDPKFQPPRFQQYLQAVQLLDRYARTRYQRSVLHLALRWCLDAPNTIPLWGARQPQELDPLPELMGWDLDEEAMRYVDEVLREAIKAPVGPEFMAPGPRPETVPSPSPAPAQWE
ncbi:MAG TPA: aldo/keto reductase [Polyangia bacterium]|jgi:aryl-alcohol dehydrogenase-like predicted oxidoreductase